MFTNKSSGKQIHDDHEMNEKMEAFELGQQEGDAIIDTFYGQSSNNRPEDEQVCIN